MDTPSPQDCHCRKVYEDYRHSFEHEHQLIDRKITWLLTSQTILFAALGFSLRTPSLMLVGIMALVGLAICFSIGVGLVGNIRAKRFVHSDYDKFLAAMQHCEWGVSTETEKLEFGVRTETTNLGIFADRAIPVAFAIAWLAVLIWSADIIEAAEAASKVS